jgi:hypothetical protein
VAPRAAKRASKDDLLEQIDELGGRLRRPLREILETVSPPPPRPARVARALGMDKTLASRLVRAVKVDSNLELVHIVPSPAGLRILAELASAAVPDAAIEELTAAIEGFEDLLDAVPGGRASIDAQISESSHVVRERREQIAKQAAFKGMSFLLGHFSDTLTTSLFLVPAERKGLVDGIEVHRRIDLRRIRPRTPLALLSFQSTPADDPRGGSVRFESVEGGGGDAEPTAFLIPEFSSRPIPDLDVVREGRLTTLVLAGGPSIHTLSRLTSAFRVCNGWEREPERSIHSVRGYTLHMPCRRLVRDIFVAEGLFPGASPRLSFNIPGPGANDHPPGSTPRHFAAVELTASIEQLPMGPQAFEVGDLGDHPAAIRHVLERAGHGATRFRGWRCTMKYPIPLVEMVWWMVHPK